MKTATALPNNLRKAREARKMTQSELGRKIGFGQARISYYEVSRGTPSIPTLIKLSEALDISIDDLLTK